MKHTATRLALLAISALVLLSMVACATTPAAAAAGGTAVGVALPDVMNLIAQLKGSGVITDSQAANWTTYAQTIGTGLQTVFGLISDVANSLHATQTTVAQHGTAIAANAQAASSGLGTTGIVGTATGGVITALAVYHKMFHGDPGEIPDAPGQTTISDGQMSQLAARVAALSKPA